MSGPGDAVDNDKEYITISYSWEGEYVAKSQFVSLLIQPARVREL